jgi:hypothetical protein
VGAGVGGVGVAARWARSGHIACQNPAWAAKPPPMSCIMRASPSVSSGSTAVAAI